MWTDGLTADNPSTCEQARNFLVFQGDVESIAQKAPKDLTALFEQVGVLQGLVGWWVGRACGE